jgi:hypothetical protein
MGLGEAIFLNILLCRFHHHFPWKCGSKFAERFLLFSFIMNLEISANYFCFTSHLMSCMLGISVVICLLSLQLRITRSPITSWLLSATLTPIIY